MSNFFLLMQCVESGDTVTASAAASESVEHKQPKEKKKGKSHVQPPAPPAPQSLLTVLNHELNNIDFAGNKVFWVAWLLMMLTMLFFGFQWKSLNEQLTKNNVEVLQLLHKILEAQEMLKKSG
jgi:hypothetical protein